MKYEKVIMIFSQFGQINLIKTFTHMWYKFHKIWLLFACSIVVVGSCLVFDLIFSLGVDDPTECENPQQSLEQQQQQGKQFDHSNPITFKFTFIYNLYTYMAILLLNYG